MTKCLAFRTYLLPLNVKGHWSWESTCCCLQEKHKKSSCQL